MAYNQGGQNYQGHYPPYHSSPEPQDTYGAYAPPGSGQQPNQRHRTSVEAGDDRVSHHNSVSHSNNSPYEVGHIRMPSQEQFLPSAAAAGRSYTGSYPNGGGLQHQGSVGASSRPAYNPQQYAQADQQYNQPAYSSPPPLITSSPSMNYQPYNPAAYSATTSHPPANLGYSTYDTSPSAYSSTSPYQAYLQNAPPLPPRPHEYSSHASQSPTAQHHSSFADRVQRHNASLSSSQTGSPNPSYPNAYTPPAPPPPPFMPNQEAPVPQAPSPRSYPHNLPTTLPTGPIHTSAGPASSYQRLPPLSHYQGSGDYSTPSPDVRHSLSPDPSSQVSASSTPPLPPRHSPRRSDTSGRHPQSRPLPGPPSSLEEVEQSQTAESESFGYDDILNEVEATVMGRTPATTSRAGRSPRLERLVVEEHMDNDAEPQPLFSGGSRPAISPDIRYSHTNGASTSGAGIDVNYDAYSDDSDAEAAAGLAAMQMAEEQEAADLARRSNIPSSAHSRTASHPTSSLQPPPAHDAGSGSDSDVPVDMGTYGGGPSGSLSYHYGEEKPQPNVVSQSEDYMFLNEDSIHPFRSFGARTDTGGTGGLAEPTAHARRLSFEDGDEATLVDSSNFNDSSSALSTERNSVRSTTSHPSRAGSRPGSRPLPQIPSASGSDHSVSKRQTDQYGKLAYPQAPDEYDQAYTSQGSYIHKANSMGSHSSTPTIVPPGRSITDAEQRRRTHLNGLRTSVVYDTLSPDSATTPSAKLGEIMLPTLPAGKRRKFDATKLSTSDFKRCTEPWAQSSILAWIKEMTEGESDLREQAIVTGIVALFTHKVPTMNTADAEVLSARLVEEMFSQGALLKDEEWVKFGTAPMVGVIFQLTGTGCYSPKVHLSTISGRCYAHHCMRTLKKINLQTHELAPQRKIEDWATFYKIKKGDIEGVPKKDIERQNNLHEIVTSEDYFMDQLNVLRVLYRDGLVHPPQPIISPKRIDGFLRDVFGKVDAVKQANEDFLLPQLKYRQEEQGPWIKGFSDIFREWIRRAKTAYADYASSLPKATLLVKKEAERNVLFRQFLDQVRENERSRRLGWDTYLKAPITRLQRYGLLLQTVQKNMVGESEEKTNLATAIEEIKVVTLDCDARVAEQSKRSDLDDLAYKLKLRPGMEKVQLNLNHLGREIVYRGDLQRRGRATWLDIHAILFDHYMVLSKPIQQRDAAGGLKHEVYDVSKLPIPMDLLVLDSLNDDPVVKSTVKGISAANLTKPAVSTPGGGTGGPGTLMHTNTNTSSMSNGSSARSLVTTTVLDSPNDKILYPFRIKHLGKSEVYVLFAQSASNRQEWCDKIIEAKTRHASSLFRQNAEPFRLRVLADTAFAYDSQSGGQRGVVIKGTPLDRAVEECEKSFYGTGPKPTPVCRAQVNCATTFNRPFGKRMVAVGTDYGVFTAEDGNARAWTRVINASHVTQIAVLEDFSLFIIISDKSLIAYHLDTIASIGGAGPTADSRKAPQKLSGNRDVGFFAVARQKDRTLVFYKKKDGISSTFKVLEPVYQKTATSTRSRFAIKRGTTDFFRDFDDFYIPSDTYAINLFQSSLAISTARGIEILTLDKKVPISVPDLKPPEVASIAQRIQGQKPLGMFRLSDNEFLVAFEEVGIYVDKHGDVSRAVVMEFVGKAKQACLIESTYLVLVDAGSGFVEVRNAVNGRLRQVISGRDVKLLDDGQSSGTAKICMQHPEQERNQIVLEMVINQGLKE